MMEVNLTRLLWDEANEAHIARHQVSGQEVSEVVFGAKTAFAVDDSHRRGRLVAYGATAAGRYLVVVLDEPTTSGTAYVVTARPMTAKELREYQEAQNDQTNKAEDDQTGN
jgi:uncharacterized DUF497 family protein